MRTFRVPRASQIVAAVLVAVFPAVTVAAYWSGGWSWTTLTLSGLTVFGLAGLLDVLTSRVELHDDRLVVVRNLRKRRYDRTSLTKVTWAKGSPVSVQSASGEWIRLPGVGPSAQGMVNTLRAWLKG